LQTPDVLRERITQAAGRGGLSAYRGVAGAYDFGHFQVFIDYIQKDVSSSPTRLRLRVDQQTARFPKRFTASPAAYRATADWIARQAAALLERRGSDAMAGLTVDAGNQVVLERTAVRLFAEAVELRLTFHLATEGALAITAAWERMLFSDLPTLAREALLFDSRTSDVLRQHVESVEDQAALREDLHNRGWVAFLGEGTPIECPPVIGNGGQESAVFALRAPEELRDSVTLANGEALYGLALPPGVTVVVGGVLGWQGELLRAIESGIYDHVPGHAHERVVSDVAVWRVRPEEGRSISDASLAWFLRAPQAEDATAATSGAGRMESLMAGVLEAVEAGCRVLLLDEQECPAGFLCADARIRALLEEASGGLHAVPYGQLAREL
jgi:predicted ABC-class ATPase